MRYGFLASLLGVTFLTTVAWGATEDVAVERAPMSKETYEILRDAVIQATEWMEEIRKDNPERFGEILKNYGLETEDLRKESLEALELLRTQSWPDVKNLRWVHVSRKRSADDEPLPAWLVSEGSRKVVLVGEYLQDVVLWSMRIERIEPADFKTDLQDLIDLIEKGDTPWMHFTRIRGERYPFHEGAYIFGYAYAAASAGLTEEVKTLIAYMLYPGSPYPQRLRGPYNELVWQQLRPAMLRFQKGSPREEFLATCKDLLAKYPDSDFDYQLRSLIEPMERSMKAPPPSYLSKKPEELTEEERVQCTVYELRDVAGQMGAQPGRPHIFGILRPTKADKVVAFGTAAVPYLIDALEDDQPTRTLGWWRDFHAGYYLLRKKDVALLCLEKIAGRTFYDSVFICGQLSDAEPQVRSEVIAEVKRWWKKQQNPTGRRREMWIGVGLAGLLLGVALLWLALRKRKRKLPLSP